jgi:SAM-dependent methyltransferase
MVTESRWQTAQEYERGFWQAQADDIAAGMAAKLEWYQWRSEQLSTRLSNLGLSEIASGNARVVEVGSGPIGVVTFFPGRRRVACDPLSDFYGSNAQLSELRDPLVEYVAAPGEALPCNDGSADLVIIENCIDHVRDMDVVLQEIRRVLDRDGLLYLTVNNRTRPGYYVHRLLSRLKIDKGHPHTLTPSRTRRLVERNGFRIVDFQAEYYRHAFMADLRGPGLRPRLKAILGVSEYVVSLVARRSEGEKMD